MRHLLTHRKTLQRKTLDLENEGRGMRRGRAEAYRRSDHVGPKTLNRLSPPHSASANSGSSSTSWATWLPRRPEKTGVPNVSNRHKTICSDNAPSSYVWLGTGFNPDYPKLHNPHNPHNPHFDFNDEQLALGAAYWVQLTETRLNA